jgi:hypothetical protein
MLYQQSNQAFIVTLGHLPSMRVLHCMFLRSLLTFINSGYFSFAPTSADPSKLQLHISIWNDAGSEPFLGHCYVNLSTFTHEDVQKNVNLIALPDDSQVDLCVALSKLKSDKKKLYGRELALILQSPAKLSKYVEKSHLFNEKSQVLEQASKGKENEYSNC